jgi:ribosomal protein L12E/L44/L45/RPP1/RPP2
VGAQGVPNFRRTSAGEKRREEKRREEKRREEEEEEEEVEDLDLVSVLCVED